MSSSATCPSFLRGPHNQAFFFRENDQYRTSAAIHFAHGKAHLNLQYQFNGSRLDDERDGRYEVALGYSRRLGASALLVADLVRYQEMTRDEEANLAEVGLRFATTPQSVLSVGVGVGFGDESPDVRVTVGFQYEF